MGRKQRTWKKYSESEIRHMIKKVNDSLYRLEKAGLQAESAEYRKIEKYALSAPNGTGKMYNVDMFRGTIRVSKDLSRYKTKKERDKFVEVLEGILSAQTRTVSGTRKAMKKGFETVKQLYGFQGTQKQYTDVWKMYRKKVAVEKKSRIGSDTVMQLIEKTNIYQLSKSDLEKTMDTLARARSGATGVRSAIRNVKSLKVRETKRRRKKT